jgi:hypothetical protein
VAGGIGGTFAGFVDTEESKGNFYQAGISDLLVNGKNDPIGAKVTYVHGTPQKSHDLYIDLFNWGVCEGGDVYMHIKNVVSVEAGVKAHGGANYVYDGVAQLGGDIPNGYDVAVPPEPKGAGVWSSEPEKISEVGGGMVGQIYINPWWIDDPNNGVMVNPAKDANLLGEDYASGISDHLSVLVQVCDDIVAATGAPDGILDDADDNGDGQIDLTEYGAHDWTTIFNGKLKDIFCTKTKLGFLATQTYGWIHITLVLQQIEAFATDPDTGAFLLDLNGDKIPWPVAQLKWWPTNALQGDMATWDMLFELNTDP